MKRCLVWLFLCIFLCPSGMAERKKVGLVLSGGGAKGIAHIGVIEVLEKAGIPVDYVREHYGRNGLCSRPDQGNRILLKRHVSAV